MNSRLTARAADEGEIIGRGISFPFRLDSGGRVAWSAGTQNVAENIRAILVTELGERIMLAEFGTRIQSAIFEPNTPATRRLIEKEIQEAIERWEPRVQLENVRVQADADDERSAVAIVTYRHRTTLAEAQVAMRIVLGG